LVNVEDRHPARVERVEAGERDELEPVSQACEIALEARDLGVRQVLAPVERPRTVVREELARIALVDRGCEALRLVQVRRGGLAPDEVGLVLRNPRDVEQIWLDEFAYNADRDPVRHASSGTTGQSPSSWTK
jgi:hypothetical protein